MSDYEHIRLDALNLPLPLIGFFRAVSKERVRWDRMNNVEARGCDPDLTTYRQSSEKFQVLRCTDLLRIAQCFGCQSPERWGTLGIRRGARSVIVVSANREINPIADLLDDFVWSRTVIDEIANAP